MASPRSAPLSAARSPALKRRPRAPSRGASREHTARGRRERRPRGAGEGGGLGGAGLGRCGRGWRPGCGEKWDATWAGRLRPQARDSITGPKARGPNQLETPALGPGSGPALFPASRWSPQVWPRRGPRCALGAVGAPPSWRPRPCSRPGCGLRSPVDPATGWEGEDEEEGLDQPGRAGRRVAPGKLIDTTFRRRPRACLIKTVDSLLRSSGFIGMVAESVPSKSSIVRPEAPLSALAVARSS